MDFLIIGGDTRNLKLADILIQNGHTVQTMALGEEYSPSLQEPYVIGPMPFTTDGVMLNAPLAKQPVKLNDFTDITKQCKMIIAGKIPKQLRQHFEEQGILVYDYLDYEEINIYNCIPTAEGAIEIAMNTLPITLHGSSALVIGYGRIGKILANKLKLLDVNTVVLCRKNTDHALCEANGLDSIFPYELESNIQKMDVIFNTAPAPVLDSHKLSKIKKDCVVIDLASAPGGCDFAYGKEAGIKIIHALSLPGKVAPVTCANILYKVIAHIIEERS